MSDMKPMHKQLREIGELLGLDCGDNSCLCAPQKGGMRTNGGCRCDISGTMLARVEAYRADNARLRAELEGSSYNEGFREGTAAGIATVCDKWPGIEASAEQVVALVKAVQELEAASQGPDELIGELPWRPVREALKPFEEG